MGCCFPCSTCRYDGNNVSVQLSQREHIQESLLNEWERLGQTIKGDTTGIDTKELQAAALKLRTINEKLIRRQNALKVQYRLSAIANKISKIAIILTTALTAGLLCLSAITSCGLTEALFYICIISGAVSFVTPLITSVFQECHDKINENKIRMEAFTADQAREDFMVDRFVSILSDYQKIHEFSLMDHFEDVIGQLSVHGKELLEKCSNKSTAKNIIKKTYAEEFDDLPRAYRKKNRWKNALKAIAIADRARAVSDRSLHKRFGASDEEIRHNAAALVSFGERYTDLREELLEKNEYIKKNEKDDSTDDDLELMESTIQ